MASIARKRVRKTRSTRKSAVVTPKAPKTARSALLDVMDELHDLIAALGCIGDVRLMATTMHDIEQPPPPGLRPAFAPAGTSDADDDPTDSMDRIGRAGLLIDAQKWNAALEELAEESRDYSDADLIDMRSAADSIIGCVRLRLARIIRLIRILP